MPVFGQNKRREGALPLSTFETSTTDVLSASFEEAFEQNPMQRLIRYGETKFGDQTNVTKEAASAFAEENFVSNLDIPEAGMSRGKLETLVEFKREQKVRQAAIEAAGGGFINTTAGLTSALVASVLDPVNIAESFIPVIGAAKWASRLKNASGAAKYASRFGQGFAAGVQGTVLTEGGLALGGVNAELQEDIGFSEFMQMTILGGFLGGGLHTTVGLVKDIRGKSLDAAFDGKPTKGYGEKVAKMSPEQKIQATRHAVAALAEDRRVDMTALLEAQRYVDMREYGDLARKANQASLSGQSAAEIKSLTTRMQDIAVRMGEDFEKPPAAKAFDDTTIKQSHVDANGKLDDKAARKDLVDQFKESLELGDDVTIRPKGADAPIKVKEINSRGMLIDENGGVHSPASLLKKGFDAEINPKMDPDAPPGVGIEELNALNGRFMSEINIGEDVRIFNALKEVNSAKPGSLFVDEESFARFQADSARLKAISDMPESQRIQNIEAEITDRMQRFEDAFPEPDEMAKSTLADTDFEVKRSNDFIDGLKAMGNCLIRGG